jgi:hypothetical protein
MRIYYRPRKQEAKIMITLSRDEVDVILGEPHSSAGFLVDMRAKLRLMREEGRFK